MGDFWGTRWQQTYQVNPSFSLMWAFWKYVNNGNLPGKSAGAPSVPKSPIDLGLNKEKLA